MFQKKFARFEKLDFQFEKRGTFRTQSNIYDEAFFRKYFTAKSS